MVGRNGEVDGDGVDLLDLRRTFKRAAAAFYGCDPRCRFARGPDCDCKCRGIGHGAWKAGA